jgi:hypothetical protein
MTEARIGRVVAAALHQAVSDVLPLRLEFYETYLEPRRLRTGTIGVASFWAALSFLRRDGEAYPVVMREAGRLAADWIWDGVPPYLRAVWRRLPESARARAVLRLSRRLVTETISTSRVASRLRGGVGRLVIDGSAFCDPRAEPAAPLCGFYVAAIDRLCERAAIGGRARAEACRGLGAASCVLVLRLGADREAAEDAAMTGAAG